MCVCVVTCDCKDGVVEEEEGVDDNDDGYNYNRYIRKIKKQESQKETKREAQMSSHSRLLSFSPVQFGVVKPTRDGLCLSELSQVQKLK